MTRFYQQVYAAMIRHFDLDQLKAVIIASPGFTREAILQFVMEEAQVLAIHALAF
jgi:protein pelota